MNLYGMKRPTFTTESPAEKQKQWDAFRERLAKLQVSHGSQSILRIRRDDAKNG